MVHSQINRQLVYKEDSDIEKKDHNFQPHKYPTEMTFDQEDDTVKFYITFGRKNEAFLDSHHIIYYPVYLVAKNAVVSKIGILEVEPELEKNLVDEDGVIDPDRLEYPPLFFSFLTHGYLTSQGAILLDGDEDSDDDTASIISGSSSSSSSSSEEDKDEDTIGFETDDDMFKIPRVKLSQKTSAKKALSKSPFEETGAVKNDTATQMPKQLVEETKTMAEDIKSKFEESSKTEWIEHFMKNNYYGIEDNEGGGDCLFAVIRDAFQEVGKMTTVDTLRELLAEEATDEVFQQYRTVYLATEDSVVENDREIANLTNMMKEYKRRVRSSEKLTKAEHEEIIHQADKAKKQMDKLKKDNYENAAFLRYNFGFMKGVHTLEEFKELIKTSRFWADTWAISTLEDKLNCKLIIFSEEAYNEGSPDSVLNCGEAATSIQKRGKFTPEFYIMTSYSGTHYRLITYRDRKIFDFSEIPYDVKILIINKCMERNSGIFYLIQDFRNLKSKIGLSPEEGEPEEELDDAYLSSLYDKNIVFVLDIHAPTLKDPGTSAQGEKIPANKKQAFMKLAKIKSWRRKLHDSWTDAPFTLDGKRWASVEHYYQGAKFRKQHPDFYAKFSLDSRDSEFNEDVAAAKTAGRKSKNKYRPGNINIDPDFYDGERSHNERQQALKAKFDGNLDLKEALLLTGDAKLVIFVRQSPPEVDVDLMTLRRTFGMP
jgi:predicted NAD-dependent protein-ADP-ribosyltransferase YbiA (DUF1768 family)